MGRVKNNFLKNMSYHDEDELKEEGAFGEEDLDLGDDLGLDDEEFDAGFGEEEEEDRFN